MNLSKQQNDLDQLRAIITRMQSRAGTLPILRIVSTKPFGREALPPRPIYNDGKYRSCCDCNQIKPMSEFSKHHADVRRCYCRHCQSKRNALARAQKSEFKKTA